MAKCLNVVVEDRRSNPARMDSEAATDGIHCRLPFSSSFFPVVDGGKRDRVL
jgi:hypothetical protein